MVPWRRGPQRVRGDLSPPRGVWGDGSPPGAGGSWVVVPPASRVAARSRYFDTATDQWNLSSLPAGTCGLPESILFDPENPQIVLVAMSVAASCGGVLRSVDGGVTFSSPAGNSALTQRSVGCNSIINIPTLRRWPVGCGGGGNTQRRVPLDRLRSELANHSRKHRASLGYRRDVVWRLPVRIDVWGRGAPFALCVLAGACCRHTVFQ